MPVASASTELQFSAIHLWGKVLAYSCSHWQILWGLLHLMVRLAACSGGCR